MRNMLLLAAVCLLCWLGVRPLCAQTACTRRPVRVACVGNSITYGAGIAARQQNSYPAQLQYFLGDGFEVQNFGVSGRCAGRQSNYPYIETEAYRRSLAFEPDIVLIGFGTNDSKPVNFKHHDSFKADYAALIDSYRRLKSRPRIILLTPLSCFVGPVHGEGDIDSARIASFFVPAVQQLAYELGLEVIDMYHMFSPRQDPCYLPDRLHPSAIGAADVACRLGLYLQRLPSGAAPVAMPAGARRFNFYGYQGYAFTFEGVEARIVAPRREAKGRPWVWRARFWGHQPQTDQAMLEAGFHIVYCDVADLYGQQPAIERWDHFYKWLRHRGFDKRCVLEGMSRGGLIVYNWAARHPHRVAAIYADAPVMSLTSWPVESERRQGDSTNTRRLLTLVGATTPGELPQKSVSPMSAAAVLTRHKVPIIHVVGMADDVVPVAQNTEPFAREMERLGWPITVIRKAGCNHHPHSLSCPTPIVRFLLKAAGHGGTELPGHAMPGNEYRGNWPGRNDWHSRARALDSLAATIHPRVLFVGNSITQNWGASAWRLGMVNYQAGGAAVMDSLLGPAGWDALAIQGDRTQYLLHRLRYGHYDRARPQCVVVAIGVNNLLVGGDFPDEVARGIKACTDEAVRRFPEARVLTVGLFPAGTPGSDLRRKYEQTRAALSKMKWGRATYIDLHDDLLTPDGHLRPGCYSSDAIHLIRGGYRIWARRVMEWMNQKQSATPPYRSRR